MPHHFRLGKGRSDFPWLGVFRDPERPAFLGTFRVWMTNLAVSTLLRNVTCSMLRLGKLSASVVSSFSSSRLLRNAIFSKYRLCLIWRRFRDLMSSNWIILYLIHSQLHNTPDRDNSPATCLAGRFSQLLRHRLLSWCAPLLFFPQECTFLLTLTAV